ncbi:hypothetical protein M1O29_00460 [Dehalococcoidia bacterium]|nr:hypothetical protein [Dehalococcoidia bacterium]
MNISSKTMTGVLLLLSPIMVFIFWGLLWPASDADTAAEAVANIADTSKALSIASGMIGTIFFTGIFVAYTMLSRSYTGDGKSAGTHALIAGILFPICAAVLVTSSSLFGATIEAASDGLTDKATTLYMVGDNLWVATVCIWGIAMTFLGLAVCGQTAGNNGKVYGLPLATTGVLMFLTGIISVNAVEGIAWLLLALSTIWMGIGVLRSKIAA